MAAVMAGFVCGYALSLLATPLVAIAMFRGRGASALMRRFVPDGSSLAAVTIAVHVFALLTCTAAGILFGIALATLEDSRPAGGLGSPNEVFTALIIATAAIAVLPIVVAVPRWRLPLLACALVFVATFGWAMPYLSLAANAKS